MENKESQDTFYGRIRVAEVSGNIRRMIASSDFMTYAQRMLVKIGESSFQKRRRGEPAE